MRRSLEDEVRFRELFRACYPLVVRFVARRHSGDVEAVAAETFTVAWRRLADVPGDADAARAWLFATARRCLLNEVRADRRREGLAVRVEADTDGSVEWEPDQLAARLDLVRAWRSLPAAAQEVLALNVFDDLTSQQAGQVLGISAASYRQRLARARAALERAAVDGPQPSLTVIEGGGHHA